MKQHIAQFEVLRGIAALWVFFSHVLLISEASLPPLNSGDMAVDLFVILSGFVITLMANRKHETYGIYIFRRFVRLYPLYIVALLGGLLTQHLYGPVVGQSLFGWEPQQAFLARDQQIWSNFWQHMLLHLAMLHGAVPDSVLPSAALAFSGPLWSISLEWQFYLVAPALVWALDVTKSRRWPIALGAIALIFCLRFLAQQYWTGSVPSFLPLRLDLFAVGIICAHLWPCARNAPLAMVAVLPIAGLALSYLTGNHWLPMVLWFLTYAVAACGDRSLPSSIANQLYTLPPLRWLGERSYGLYVLHMPIVLGLTSLLVLPHVDQFGRRITFCILLAMLPVVLLVADWLYRNVEVPFIAWGRAFARRQAPAVPVEASETA